MLPLITMRHYSKFVVDYITVLLAVHNITKDTMMNKPVMDISNFNTVQDTVFVVSSQMNKEHARSLREVYPALRAICVAGCKNHELFPELLEVIRVKCWSSEWVAPPCLYFHNEMCCSGCRSSRCRTRCWTRWSCWLAASPPPRPPSSTGIRCTPATCPPAASCCSSSVRIIGWKWMGRMEVTLLSSGHYFHPCGCPSFPAISRQSAVHLTLTLSSHCRRELACLQDRTRCT